jgi:hypothetical protein
MRREDRHPIGEICRLADVVGHEENRLPRFLPDLLQLLVQDVASLSVERGEGLVHEQDLRIHREGAGDGNSLSHASGQLMRVRAGESGEMHHSQKMHRSFVPLGSGDSHAPERKFDVPEHVEPRKERGLLKHHASICAGARDDPTCHTHDSAAR